MTNLVTRVKAKRGGSQASQASTYEVLYVRLVKYDWMGFIAANRTSKGQKGMMW